jgi:hypothetical protein
MLPQAFGLDPDETWEIDFSLEAGRMTLEGLGRALTKRRAELAAEKDEAKRAALEGVIASAEKAAANLEADLASYEPGCGPVFVVGPIPNGKRAEIDGESYEALRLADGKEKLARDRAWAESIVRWAVRDHRGFLSGKSRKPIPFVTEEVDFAGGKRTVVARRTLEAYGPILGDLALLILRSQRIDEAGKNA